MRITGVSNFNFTKLPQRNSKTKKQIINIYNPESKPDSEKILVIMTKNPIKLYSYGLSPQNSLIYPTSADLDEE